MTEHTVADVMTAPALTVSRDDGVADVAGALIDAGINSVVVVDADSRPVGILTSTDYVRLAASGTDPAATVVGTVMTTDVITIGYGAPVRAAAERMRDHGISHLPVVDGDGEVIGVVTDTDLTGYLAEHGADAGGDATD